MGNDANASSSQAAYSFLIAASVNFSLPFEGYAYWGFRLIVSLHDMVSGYMLKRVFTHKQELSI